jgi:Domain of unknown function (DUF4397)
MNRHPRVRWILTVLAVAVLSVSAPVAARASTARASAAQASAAQASAARASTAQAFTAKTGDGWIRLAHLSPNTPAVDVYLYSFGDSSALVVLKHVGYGDVSPYESVAAGEYSVAMRAAGASASSSPVLSTTVQIQPGHAYTVAGLGPESGLRLAILDDQLTTPPARALVRVIQASLRQHVVNVAFGGHTLAPNLAFASVSSYQSVDPGTEAIQVTSANGDAKRAVALTADTVHTLVVLDGAKGLEIVDLEDAAGNTTMPAGGVATGLGGTAPHGPASLILWLVLIAVGSMLVVAGGTRMWLLRRWRVTRLSRLPRKMREVPEVPKVPEVHEVPEAPEMREARA